jgi:hypothetical protein
MNTPLINSTIANHHMGFYTVNNIPFYSKNEAAIFAQKTNSEFKWNFNDEIFKANDWTIEPTETLDELYDRRARDLRQQYDYLILSYSGGSDTHNILSSFLRQGLLIDEILVNTNEKINRIIVNDSSVTANWNYGAEYKLQIYPRLNEVKNKSPNTRITVVDTSDNILETFNSANDASWISETREPINVSAITRYNYLYFKEVRKRIDKEKSIAMIVGVEKPCTVIIKNKFYIAFTDKMANLTPIQQHFQDYTNTHTEYFYWHPSCLKMLTKQAHTIKRWLVENPQNQKLWTPETTSQWLKNNGLYQNTIKSVIYSTWNSSWFQADKDTRFWYGQIDEWWHRYYSNTKEYAIWKEGINYIENNASNFIVYNDGLADGIITMIKVYYVADMPESNFTKVDSNSQFLSS